MRRNNLINQKLCSWQLGGNISKFCITDIESFSLVQFLSRKENGAQEFNSLQNQNKLRYVLPPIKNW